MLVQMQVQMVQKRHLQLYTWDQFVLRSGIVVVEVKKVKEEEEMV